MPLFAVTNLVFQSQQQVEGDVCRLEILSICMSDVVHQGAESRASWRRNWRVACNQRSRMKPGKQAHGYRFHVAFNACDLPGKEDVFMRFHLQALR